ncbi:MAG: TIGR01459 family HAD-type hydrolase [Betaproteobacteria bacterium]|nr:TIGR01459 family HAD-type hydrolase [Betaproteobacteria bacterium]
MRASPEAAGSSAQGAIALPGVAALAPLFDGYIVDQWGVLHDGTRPYPGALDCLERLHEAGKHVVVLSNSGRREAANVRLMQEMGFPARLFDRMVSAGEDAREAIIARASPFHASLGRRCYAFTRSGDRSILEGIGLTFVTNVEEADFLAAIGIDSPYRRLADYEAELVAARSRGLPMICANPDIARFLEGALVEATGVLARRYGELGGEVFHHGKPWPAIYASCLAALGTCAPGRVIAVGDSIEHDILGASRAGLPSAFIAAGIHAQELGVAFGAQPDPTTWREFEGRAIARPDYRLPAFTW